MVNKLQEYSTLLQTLDAKLEIEKVSWEHVHISRD